MIFVDASAIVAILTDEPEAMALVARLERDRQRTTSASAIFEAALALMHKRQTSPENAQRAVLAFLRDAGVSTQAIAEDTAMIALDAHTRYGKGRHPAALNMGDCFSYACAKLSGAALLYKGADFDATDLGSR